MKIKTAEATGPVLDYLVAKCEGVEFLFYDPPRGEVRDSPSTDWSQGGPIIEREGIYLKANNYTTEWKAGALSLNRYDGTPGPLYSGPTPLIAAMRCYVASKLGEVVNVPEELK